MCKDSIVFNNKPKGVTLEAGKEYAFCACGRSENSLDPFSS